VTPAERIAHRFRQATGSPESYQHKAEAAEHRASEILRTINQQHKFWVDGIHKRDTLAVEQAHKKMETLLHSYGAETSTAMIALDEWETAAKADGVTDYPESAERS
jgi:hypothetical protein